ncbi:MAG TPA: dihydroorotase family protein, partial [Mycobacteriales bacterium]
MSAVDLLVAGGTVVTVSGRRRANIAVDAGRITYVGPERPTATTTVDADGLFVLPGGVDTHVHLMDPGAPEREDFPSGTAAAAANGVTTIIEHTHGHPVRTVDDLADKRRHLVGRSHVDYALAAHAWPGHVDDVAALWAAGAAFFKVFTCTTHGVPGHDAAALLAHLHATAAVDAVSLVHCEDESLTRNAERLLREAGRTDGGIVPEWRSRDAELVAVAVTAMLVRRAGARATVAHVSHPEVAGYVARERRRGARLAAEGCPQYFLLREDEVLTQGPLRKFTPPARARTSGDEATMWELLRTGELTHMSTDHAPATLAQKADGDIWSVHFGLPGLDSTMALLLDAVGRDQLSLEDVVGVYSERPARIYGLWPAKGSVRVGADADLVLVDMAAERILRNEA